MTKKISLNGHVEMGNDDTEKLHVWYNQDITQEWILKSGAYHISHFSSFCQRCLILNHRLIVKEKTYFISFLSRNISIHAFSRTKLLFFSARTDHKIHMKI